jgi:hypothetical protein
MVVMVMATVVMVVTMLVVMIVMMGHNASFFIFEKRPAC